MKTMVKRQTKKNILEKRFREKLKALIRNAKVKNRELAEYLSRHRLPGEKAVTDAYISQIKSGERGVSLDRACLIARFFDIDPGELFQYEPRRKEFRILYNDLPQDKLKNLRSSNIEDTLLVKVKGFIKKELEAIEQ